MNKKVILGMLTISALTMATLSMTACNGKGGDTQGTETAITANGGKVTCEEGTVELGAYKGIAVEKVRAEVSEEDVDEEVNRLVEENITREESKGPAEEGNEVVAVIKATSDGKDIEYFGEEPIPFVIGEGDYGPEFDEAIKGHKAGDQVELTVKYDKDYENEFLADQKIDYKVELQEVSKLVTPELTDDFIINTLGYESEKNMREELKKKCMEDYEAQYTEEMYYNIMQEIMDKSNVTDYSKDLYEEQAQQFEEEAAAQAVEIGGETAQDYYEFCGMTEDDVKAAILYYVQEEVIIKAIAKQQNIDITDEEYKDKLARMTEEYEVEDEKEILDYFGEENIRYMALQDKVYKFLADNASITEVDPPSDTEGLEAEDIELEEAE